MIDTHCHLDFAVFDEDRDNMMARAQSVGVKTCIVPSVARRNWHAVAALGEHPHILTAYGLHPAFLQDHQPADVQALSDWLAHHDAVAIGEVGLDGRYGDSCTQRWLFDAQIELALAHDLPLIVHAHRALDAVLHALQRTKPRFVIHAFSGSDQQLARLLDLGGMVGVGGTITYPRAQRLRRQIATLPEQSFVLETDAPDQPVSGYQGIRNEPAQLRLICDSVAALRQQTPEAIAQQTTDNALAFFTDSPNISISV